jgi:hypothetical protein
MREHREISYLSILYIFKIKKLNAMVIRDELLKEHSLPNTLKIEDFIVLQKRVSTS